MGNAVEKLLDKLAELENLVEREVADRREEFHYRVERGRVVFERQVLRAHRELRTRVPRFVRESGLLATVFSPLVYALIVPIALLDLAVSLFQAVCFPVYGIAKARRADYVVIDRHHLAYLNGIEKLNCVYCGYANGVIAFVHEVASRSEEHWCPIKHARRVQPPHKRYYRFAAYGDADGYVERKQREMRKERGG